VAVFVDVCVSASLRPNVSKLLQIADTFLLGAYRKVARGYRMVTSPMTSRDYDVIVVMSQPSTCYIFDSS